MSETKSKLYVLDRICQIWPQCAWRQHTQSLSTEKIAHDFMAQFLAKRRFLLQYDMESFKNSKTRHFEEAPFQFYDQVTLNHTKISSYLISVYRPSQKSAQAPFGLYWCWFALLKRPIMQVQRLILCVPIHFQGLTPN